MSTWPPPSLEVNAEGVVDECELAEITPIHLPMLSSVHMAALLYLGDFVHARHLWRRTSEPDALLQDWWALVKAYHRQGNNNNSSDEFDDDATITTALEKCSQHPEPLKTYAMQVAMGRKKAAPKPQQQHLNQQIVSFLETAKWNA